MKVINFKTESPWFEMERDGVVRCTVREFDPADPRFIALCENPYRVIRITNPTTGESFTRHIDYFGYGPNPFTQAEMAKIGWKMQNWGF